MKTPRDPVYFARPGLYSGEQVESGIGDPIFGDKQKR
jgi:hypothetical protein